MNICLTAPLKRLDKGEAVSGLMEIDHQEHLHRHCLSREPMRQANWVRTARCGSLTGASYNTYLMGLSRAPSAFYTN